MCETLFIQISVESPLFLAPGCFKWIWSEHILEPTFFKYIPQTNKKDNLLSGGN